MKPTWTVLLLLPALCRAGGDGGSSFEFLSLPAGPRQAAMGGSGVAVADDLGGAQLNPAALGRLWRREAGLFRAQWLQGATHQYAAYAEPTTRRGTFALHAFSLDHGDVEGYDISGGRTGSLRARDALGGLGYGKSIGERVSVGVTVQRLRETLHTETLNATAMDAGALYRRGRAQFGLALRHAGGADLPRALQAGLALRPFFEGLTLSADMVRFRDGRAAVRTGAEYLARGAAAFRVGHDGSKDEGNRLSAGLGLRVGNVQVDYAFAGFSSLGESHHMGITCRFGSLAEVYYERGMQALRREDYAAAIVEFSRVVDRDPGHRRALRRIREANRLLQERLKRP